MTETRGMVVSILMNDVDHKADAKAEDAFVVPTLHVMLTSVD